VTWRTSIAFEIDWSELSPEKCENLITGLLIELYPQGRRIDGRGGDGGRDYETPLDGGWHRFEVKSWCREFGKSQRQQLKESLERTLAANPVKVTIVVPLDQNEAIIAWLARQQATTAVPLEWWGRTWLETQLAARPHLVRAFARTSYERTLERLAEYHAEQAALPNGMPDAIDRYQRLQARTDEVDRHYRFITETAPGQTTVISCRGPAVAPGAVDHGLVGIHLPDRRSASGRRCGRAHQEPRLRRPGHRAGRVRGQRRGHPARSARQGRARQRDRVHGVNLRDPLWDRRAHCPGRCRRAATAATPGAVHRLLGGQGVFLPLPEG
jgi:hypothetical protein